MKKNKELKKDIIAILLYILTFIMVYSILTENNHIFASNIDFKTQHYLIPEYFRMQFLNTKNLLPDFSLNLGSGQNIYYLSYYGLLNPIILISYLFPKIKMLDYIIISSSLIVILSTILFYFFLKSHHYNFKTRFLTAFIFLCASPLIFHAKRHIMFINYFPFLITGLIGIDKYFEKKNILLLSISIALITYTSYFYSISSLVTLFIYFIYKYLKLKKKNFIKETLKIAPPVLIGILMASLIIFPTMYCLLQGRNSSSNNINLLTLIIPKIYLLYSSYSMGLTLITLIALIVMFNNQKKEIKFLARTILIISSIPIFNYILNGTLYINGKSLIPLIPLALIPTAEFIQKIFAEKKVLKSTILTLYIIISSFTICLTANLQDKLMTKEDIQNKDYQTTEELTNYIIKKDNSFYRINNLVAPKENINKITNINEYKTTMYSSTYNSNYKTFYYKTLNNNRQFRNDFMISSSNNLLSQSILGEKYIITKQKLDNLELIKEKNGIYLYRNKNALPIGYATPNIIDIKTFESLNYPTNSLVLLNNIVVDNKNIKQNTNIPIKKETTMDYEILEQKNLEIENKNNSTTIKAKNNNHLKLRLKTNPKNKIILIKFKLKNNNYNNDLSIIINDEKNTLTSKKWKYNNKNLIFNYYIYNTNILDIHIKEGNYNLKDFKTYILDYEEINKKELQEFIINKNKTKGNIIDGTINIKENSYFNISIPYDKGFKILLDNKYIEYEKTNQNFIGFPISKGKHNITIKYNAPYKKISIIISLISSITLIIVQIIYKKYSIK